MYYRPIDGVAADVIPYYENGTYYLFYLKDYRDFAKHGEGCPWHLLKTDDLVNYTDCGPVLLRGGFESQDLYVFTGSVFKKDGVYYIFYTGHNPHLPYKGAPQEKIMMATSTDLLHWQKAESFMLSAPEWYEEHDFRDPFIFYDDKNKVYKMLLAARVKEGANERRGVTAVAESKDLLHWQVSQKPFYAPNCYFTHECPDLFKLGDWYYLLFSEFNDKVATRYRMSKSSEGPWITPENDTFDGHCFYAAKTCENGEGKRIAFGWNCIKNGETDGGEWQWGGTVIPHEITQSADGTLGVVCPPAVLNQYQNKLAVTEKSRFGEVEKNGKISLGGSGFSAVIYAHMPEFCKITAKIRLEKTGKDFGLLLRSDDKAETCYKVKFEPAFNRLVFDRVPRICSYRHCDVETERRLPVKAGDVLDITVIAEGTVAEIYVNGVAMGARMFDFNGAYVGVYTENCAVSVENFAVYSGKEER